MNARDFVEQLNQVKASIKAGEGTPELEQRLTRLTVQLRDTWSAEEIKAALAANSDVPTELEEEMTTLFMLWLSHRGTS